MSTSRRNSYTGFDTEDMPGVGPVGGGGGLGEGEAEYPRAMSQASTGQRFMLYC